MFVGENVYIKLEAKSLWVIRNNPRDTDQTDYLLSGNLQIDSKFYLSDFNIFFLDFDCVHNTIVLRAVDKPQPPSPHLTHPFIVSSSNELSFRDETLQAQGSLPIVLWCVKWRNRHLPLLPPSAVQLPLSSTLREPRRNRETAISLSPSVNLRVLKNETNLR